MLPVTPWHRLPHMRNAGILGQQAAPWESFIPTFMNEGLNKSEAEELAARAYTETAELGTKQLYIQYHLLYAFKPV